MWCPGVLLASGRTTLAVFRDELPTTRRGGEGSHRVEFYKVARALGGARPPRDTNAGGPPPRRRGAPRAPYATRCVEDEKQLHVHAVVDLLVVLGLLPRADARDVVAPIRMARRRVVVARPLRRFIDETHLLFVLICQ